MPLTTTLSSVGVSNLVVTDWTPATTIRLTLASTTMTASATIQATLDSSFVSGSSAAWFTISTTAITSAFADTGYTISYLTPLAGLRISASAISSSSLTLTALQNIGL